MAVGARKPLVADQPQLGTLGGERVESLLHLVPELLQRPGERFGDVAGLLLGTDPLTGGKCVGVQPGVEGTAATPRVRARSSWNARSSAANDTRASPRSVAARNRGPTGDCIVVNQTGESLAVGAAP